MSIRFIIPVLLTVFVSVGRLFDTPDELREHFREGQTFLATGDFDAAREKYEEVAAAQGNWFIDPLSVVVEIEEISAPVQVAARYQLGNVYRTMGVEELRRAEAIFRGDTFEADGDTAEVDSLRNAGREHLRLAADSFRKVSEDPHVASKIRVMAQYLIVECLFEAEAYRDAVGACDTLLARFPESRYVERTLYTKGWSYWHLAEYDVAIGTFGEQIRRFPEGFRGDRARFQIGECYAKLERYGDAAQAFEGLVNRYDFSTYTEKALTQMELQRYREEMGETTRSLVASAYLRLGGCLLALDRIGDALEAYRTVPREYPAETQAVQRAHLRIAQTLTEKRGYEEGIWGYRDAIEHSEDVVFRGKMHAEVMRLLYESGRYEEAIQEHRLYLRAYADVASVVGMTEDEVRFRIAECFRELAEFDSAAVEYGAMIEDHPDSYLLPDAMFGLGFSHQAVGRVEEALEVYRSLTERFQDHERASAAWVQMARILYERGEYDRAVVTYREMLDLYPESPAAGAAWLELGILYRRMARDSDALDALGGDRAGCAGGGQSTDRDGRHPDRSGPVR